MAGYAHYPFMTHPYHDEDEGPNDTDSLYYQVLKKTHPLSQVLIGAFNDNLHIEGEHLDTAYFSGMQLLLDMFPDTSSPAFLQPAWLNFLNVSTVPNALKVLQALTAKQGRLSKAFYIKYAQDFWGYTIQVVTDQQFTVADTSPPATQLPAMLYDASGLYHWYVLAIVLSPNDSPDYRTQFEAAITYLKPAFTVVGFSYV